MKRKPIRRWYVVCSNGNWFPGEAHTSAADADDTRKRADKDRNVDRQTGHKCSPHRVMELREVRRKRR